MPENNMGLSPDEYNLPEQLRNALVEIREIKASLAEVRAAFEALNAACSDGMIEQEGGGHD